MVEKCEEKLAMNVEFYFIMMLNSHFLRSGLQIQSMMEVGMEELL